MTTKFRKTLELMQEVQELNPYIKIAVLNSPTKNSAPLVLFNVPLQNIILPINFYYDEHNHINNNYGKEDKKYFSLPVGQLAQI